MKIMIKWPGWVSNDLDWAYKRRRSWVLASANSYQVKIVCVCVWVGGEEGGKPIQRHVHRRRQIQRNMHRRRQIQRHLGQFLQGGGNFSFISFLFKTGETSPPLHFVDYLNFSNFNHLITSKQACKARRCDSYLQIWNYQSLTNDPLTGVTARRCYRI